MKTLILLMSLLAASIASAEAGHTVGNGGGVICIRGVCKTLVEAGLQLSPQFNGVWIPEKIHYQDVEAKIKKTVLLPAQLVEDVHYRVFQRVDHFRKVDVVDPAKLEQIKKLYLDIADEAGFPIDPNSFEIVAFSSDDTVTPAMTYLLPGFFKLDQENQADILIHEGLYRGRPSSDLKYILQFENTMHSLNRDKGYECNLGGQKSCINQQILAYRLGFISKSELVGLMLSIVLPLRQYGHFVTQDWEIPRFGQLSIKKEKSSLVISPRQILDLGKVEPRLPYMFSRVQSLNLREDVGGSDSKLDGKMTVDWSNKGKTQFWYCTNTGGGWKTCSSYVFDDPANIDLILPE